MGGTLEKQNLDKEPELDEILNNGKGGNKNQNQKNKNQSIEEQSTKSLKKIENKVKRNGVPKKKKNDKVSIFAKDKEVNLEKKVLELIHEKNPDKEDYDLIYDKIRKHFFLQTLNNQATEEIIISMSLYTIKEGKTLYSQGHPGNYWYIVNSGELERYHNNKLIGKLGRGDSFGERALMNGAPRSNTVIAKTDCKLWALKRQVFRKILEFIFTSNYEENMKFLDGINMPLDPTFKSIMANNLMQENYLKGQFICKEGELGSCMYIIKDGEVECLKADKVIRTLKKGENFGQKALLEDGIRSLDVKAKTNCKIYSISTEFFKNQFGENFRQQLYYSFIITSFLTSKTFSNINKKIISKTFKFFSFRSLKNGELVYPKGQKINEKLCVVLEGNIVDKKINKVEAKRYEILFEKKLSEGNTDNIKNNLLAEPDCILSEIDYEKFQEILGGDIKTAQTKSNQLESFRNIPLFRILSDEKIEFLQNNLKVEKFQNGKKIINQGDIGDKLFIIKQGRVDFFVNSRYIRSLNDGEEFGAR